MTGADPMVIHSVLSQRVTLDGITVDVRIFRLPHRLQWVLEVANEWGSSSISEQLFATDVAALGAFQATVQEEGMISFLLPPASETMH